MAIDFNQPVTKDMLQSMRQLRQKQRAASVPISGKPIINAQYGQHSGWDTALDYLSNLWTQFKPQGTQAQQQKLKQELRNNGWQPTSRKKINQTVDKGSGRQNSRQYLPGVVDREHAEKYLTQNIIDPKTGTIAKLSPQKNTQIKKKYNQWAKRYKYYGGQPSLAKWLTLHMSQATRNAQSIASEQSDKQTGSGQGMRIGLQDIGNQQMAGNQGAYIAGLFSPKARQGAQDAIRAGKRHMQNLQKVRKLPADQQISYFSTMAAPAAVTAGAAVATPYIAKAAPWLTKNMLLPGIGYSIGDQIAQPITDYYNKDLRAVADALTTRDISNLTKPQQVILDNLRKQYHLGDAPDILWDAAAKSLYNKAGHNQRIGKTLMSTGISMIPTGKGYSFIKQLPLTPVYGYLNYKGVKPSTTAAQDVLQGNISDEDMAQMQAIADAHEVPLTRKVQAQLQNMARTKERQQGLLQNGISLVTGSKWGQNVTHGGIQNSINQMVNFGGMDPKQQKETLPGLLQNMRNLASTPWKLNALAAYTDNKDNMQRLVKSFDKYNPQQLGNLYDAVKQIQKQNNGLVPPQLQKLQAMLQQAAQTSAVTKYSAGLSQTDPQKFQAHMKSWMPLFHKVTSQNQGASQQFKDLRDKTQKAVWGHVKKNPFFINKAMSIWAMSNGFNSLADFLGSNGAFYGTLGAIGIGLPLTISLIKSLFRGGSKPQQVVQQAPMQGYQPLAYAPRGITERGLIVG